MMPCKMVYQQTAQDVPQEVIVYDLIHTHTADGELCDMYMLGWNTRTESWVTAPVWCFKPVLEKKKLLEE